MRWWMLLGLVGCSGGPLELPRGLEVVVKREGGGCEERSSLHNEEPAEGEVTNRSGDPRLVAIADLIDHVDEAPDFGFVVLSADFVNVSAEEGGEVVARSEVAAMGSNTTVSVEVDVKVYCEDGDWPEAGRHRRELPIVSTDAFGGDPIEQALRVVVVVE